VAPTLANSGTGSLENPFGAISQAVEMSNPGDTIFLLAGRYKGTTIIKHKHGLPNLPITITAYDPRDIPIIDAMAEPTNTAFHPGIALDSCSWINISALKFENCWNSVIDIHQSPYISIQYCHFTTGKWVVHPHGPDAHHTLVEHCTVHHPPQVWKGWSWLELHHGVVQYYNGGLMHPRRSGGGHVMRHNEIKNLFNGFRTRPASIKEDGNIEIYGNQFSNIRDNEFEPESWAWNMHYYQNDHINVHKMFSIDGVEGGNIYIYGNTYTQDNDPWTNYQVSGIYKYKDGPLTWPCYVFNNSFYTTARVMKYGESSNHQMKHFNNAYQFFETKNAFRVVDWQPGYAFDYDLINQDWSENIKIHQQEKNGLANTLAGFSDPAKGIFTLTKESAALDAGKVMHLPEFEWTQSYSGQRPDIGAYENNKRVEGPPFRFSPSPEGAFYEEYPRISRHYFNDRYLLLYFSAPIANADFTTLISGIAGRQKIAFQDALLLDEGYALLLSAKQRIDTQDFRLQFSQIKGKNGLPLVDWSATISCHSGTGVLPNLDFPDPWNDELPKVKEVKMEHSIDSEQKALQVEMTIDPPLDIVYRGILGFFTEDDVYLDGAYPEYTETGGKYVIDISHCSPGKYRLILLVAGEIFEKIITLE
jgi:hypothetical protein